jgi:hypothetical protein
VLLLRAVVNVTDHGQLRDRHVTALRGTFIHAVLFHLLPRVFLQTVRHGVSYCASNRDCMPDLLVEFYAIALDLPRAAILGSEIVFIGTSACLKTAPKRPRLYYGWCLWCPAP